jgi:hypothetical protein
MVRFGLIGFAAAVLVAASLVPDDHLRGVVVAVAGIAAADFTAEALAWPSSGVAAFTLVGWASPDEDMAIGLSGVDRSQGRQSGEGHIEVRRIAVPRTVLQRSAQQRLALPAKTAITIAVTTMPTASGFARHISTDQVCGERCLQHAAPPSAMTSRHASSQYAVT